ncbi:hypothetical protein ABIA39_009025 [Nocardia sp. GAS34]|uniref:terpene synthase family protein n=1 Tax=unclassified Nocardia TaxID=2637762 RepID=UPI003D20CF61
MTDGFLAKTQFTAEDILGDGFRFKCHTEADIAKNIATVDEWEFSRGLCAALGESHFRQWDLGHFVGYAYPLSRPGPGMDLIGKFMTVAIQVDDHIDHAVSAAECLELVAPFIRILRSDGISANHLVSPLHRGFAEVVRESVLIGSQDWWSRAKCSWIRSLTAVIHETVNRDIRASPAPYDLFLEIRRHSGYMEPFLDILEPAGVLNVPPVAFSSPHLSLIRQTVSDLGNFINDVYSIEKEIDSGQYDNLVLVLQNENNITIAESIYAAMDRIKALAERLVHLRSELPAMFESLALTNQERRAAGSYADALEMWVSGFVRWQTSSPRYNSLNSALTTVDCSANDVRG